MRKIYFLVFALVVLCSCEGIDEALSTYQVSENANEKIIEKPVECPVEYPVEIKEQVFIDPSEFFYVFPTNINLVNNNEYSEEVFMHYKEKLLNNSYKPFKILYRKVYFQGPKIGDVKRENEFNLARYFGTDLIHPQSSLYRNNANFFASKEEGKIKLKVEYCGYKINQDEILKNNKKAVLIIDHDKLTCSSYTLALNTEKKSIPKKIGGKYLNVAKQ